MKEIQLTQGQVALIDDEDWELVSQYKWHANYMPSNKSFYARTGTVDGEGKVKHFYLHRLLMSAKKGELVDHINHNSLDNQRSNLRICNRSENNRNIKRTTANTSGFKGVWWDKNANKWRSCIRINGKIKHLGCYDTPELAYGAYCEAAEFFHGEFACLD